MRRKGKGSEREGEEKRDKRAEVRSLKEGRRKAQRTVRTRGERADGQSRAKERYATYTEEKDRRGEERMARERRRKKNSKKGRESARDPRRR